MEHWLTKFRKSAGFESIRSLAEASGVDTSTLSRLEKQDGPKPTTETLQKLAPIIKQPIIKLLAITGQLGDDPDSQRITNFFKQNPDAKFIDEIPEMSIPLPEQVIVNGVAYKRCNALLQEGHLATDAEWDIITQVLKALPQMEKTKPKE